MNMEDKLNKSEIMQMITALAEANNRNEEDKTALDYLCHIGFLEDRDGDGEYTFSRGKGLSEEDKELLYEAFDLYEELTA